MRCSSCKHVSVAFPGCHGHGALIRMKHVHRLEAWPCTQQVLHVHWMAVEQNKKQAFVFLVRCLFLLYSVSLLDQ